MATIAFTPNIQRHVACPRASFAGATVREVLEAAFEDNPAARGYILDEQGAMRPHMVVFVDGKQITDRTGLSDEVTGDSEIYVMQALSGG